MEYFAHSQKAFVYKYVVMMSDTDQFKHTSFANYLKLMFLATDALFLPCVDSNFLSENRIRLVRSRMQFKRQTLAGDNILIKVNSSNIRDSQFTLLYIFMMEGSAELVTLGKQIYEIVDLKNDKTTTVPHNFTQLLEPIRVEESYSLYKY